MCEVAPHGSIVRSQTFVHVAVTRSLGPILHATRSAREEAVLFVPTKSLLAPDDAIVDQDNVDRISERPGVV